MTSKNLYWAKWKENGKRRGWTFALCLAVMFLLYPVYNIINLTSMEKELANLTANGGSAFDIAAQENYIRTSFASNIGFSRFFVIAAAFFAILMAVQGFSFLYSRKKMDLYMSVPVSGPKRFALIWANGIIGFAAAYLVNLLLCWGIGAAAGVIDAVMLAQSIIAFLINLLAFTAMYHTALLAVMLTGNVLTALLGCGVLFFYEMVVRLLYSGLKTMFFVSYCAVDDGKLMNLPWITPFIGFYGFCQKIWYQNGKLHGYYGNLNWGKFLSAEVFVLVLAGGVTGLLVYLLFRKRKTESYHYAIAFSGMKPVLEVFLLIPFSIAVGLLVSRTAADTGIFLFVGTMGGVLAGHAFIQLIYERELKALARRRGLAALCLLASGLVLCVFRFDLTGFDRYIPQKDEIAGVSVSLENDYSNFGRYGIPFFKGSRSLAVEDILEHMNSQRPETIDAVLAMVSKWQEAGMPGEDYDTGRYADLNSDDEKAKAGFEDCRRWIVRYTLNSGRRVYRRFYAGGEASGEQLDTVMKDPDFRKQRYQLYEEAFEQELARMKISYYDGRQEVLYTGDKEKLLGAFQKDFEDYGYRMLAQNLPCGELKFVLKNPDGYSDLEWKYPVYGDFQDTIAALSENDIGAGERESIFAAADVSGITVRYYQYDGRKDALFEPGEADEQEIVCTFENPEDIGRLLTALYPESLTETAGEEIKYVDRDSRFSVSITLTSEALKKRWSAPDMFFLKGKEPDFLEKRIKEAAVYG